MIAKFLNQTVRIKEDLTNFHYDGGTQIPNLDNLKKLDGKVLCVDKSKQAGQLTYLVEFENNPYKKYWFLESELF